MSKVFSFFNRRKNIFQPNLSRQRQPYSGPISSEKLNLFYDQFVVDVARLDNKVQEISSKIEEIKSLCDNDLESATPGYYFDGDLEMTIYTQNIYFDEVPESYVVESATPYLKNMVEFFKPGVNSSKISLLKSKLDYLEKTINIE